MIEIYAFEVWVKGYEEHPSVVNAATEGKAKYSAWLDVREAWQDTPFTAMRSRKIGAAHSDPQFLRTAAYRGLPDLRCGQRVKVGTDLGRVVGSNASANFDVEFDDDAPRYAGLRLNVHPSSLEVVPE